ncbi:CoA transferase [Nocardiopsis sp. NPDC006938]|uniref:CoA transferase n=1 Tax=Nocardiopsis sp. NPDC006938 TaxID=3364337 RepID=UPI00367B527F
MTANATPAAPLAGAVVRGVGDTTAVRVALDRLRAAGCEVVAGGGRPPASAPVGRVELLATTAGEPDDSACDLTWAPPGSTVEPEDERDVQALCGLAHLHGRSLGGARYLPVDYASVCAGVLASQAVMAAATSGPVRSTVSVTGAALTAVAPHVAEAAASADGPPARGGGPRPPFRSVEGTVFEIETLDAEAWLRFWTRLGAPAAAVASGWPPFQRRFATAVCPLPGELAATLAATPYERVRATALDTGVGVVALRPPGPATEPGPDSPWRLRGLGGPDARSPRAHRVGAPLAGVRVVEITNRIQGPLAGLLLSYLGADVVRIEPPGGDPMRGVPPLAHGVSARFTALNRGKGAVEADLKSPEGREAAADLAARADVLLYNWPPGRAERFGLGTDDLAERAPGLVHVHVDGWVHEGPDAPAPATDYLVQAHGGLAHLWAAGGEPPAPSLFTVTDVLGGMIAAEAVTAALALRTRAGTGVKARTGLVDAARLLRGVGVGARNRGPSALLPVEDLRHVVDLFPDSFTDVDGIAHARSPWAFAPSAVARR